MNDNINRNIEIKKKHRKDIGFYLSGIKKRDHNILSQVITLVESHNQTDYDLSQQILNQCLSIQNQSKIIGITGIPGVGKSTFIERLGLNMIKSGSQVAVIAVDPSSTITGGSILGDKTRMQYLSESENAFVRPSPSQGILGGVAQKTHEVITVFEAAGFDTILVETVGVGQSEALVSEMVDMFIFLTLSNTGDDLQGIKRGILEQAHHIVFTKNDGDNLRKTEQAFNELRQAMKFLPAKTPGWKPTFCKTSSLENTGFEDVTESIKSFFDFMNKNDMIQQQRLKQKIYWFQNSIDYFLKNKVKQDTEMNRFFESLKTKIESSSITPTGAAKQFIDHILSQK